MIPPADLRREYGEILREHLASPDEGVLDRAVALGREAITAGLGLLDVMAMHHDVLAALSLDLHVPIHRLIRSSAALLGEFLAPYEMSYQGFREANVKLKDVNEALARKVRELEQSEEKLLHAQKLEAVARLAGGVAHDFNNILSVILGLGEIVASKLRANDELSAHMDEILRAGERAADLTRQLLAFGRKQVSRPRDIDVNDVITGMRRMIHRLIGEDVRVDFRLAMHPGTVRADPGQIEQVVMNLVVNARDAMPIGGAVTITTERLVHPPAEGAWREEARDRPHVVISVRDTGMGMDAKTKEKIFEPFFTTKEVGKGTGLGLSTVYGIVHQSGGTVTVDSEPGKGSTFRVHLPCTDARVEPGGKAEPGALQPGTATILVVEDDPGVRVLVTEVLRAYGYVPLPARDGAEALHVARTHTGTIDLILSDVIMPGANGVEVAKQLAVLLPKTPVLFMSGHPGEVLESHGISEDAGAFLEKPIRASHLLQKVGEMLGRREV